MKALLALSLLLSGCAFQPSLIGTWVHTTNSYDDSVLTVDYQGTYQEVEQGGCTYSGTWSDDGSEATLDVATATPQCGFPACSTFSLSFHWTVNNGVIDIEGYRYHCEH